MQLRRKRDGTLHLVGDAPDRVTFSAGRILQWSLEGVARGAKTEEGDILTLSFDNATVEYRIVEIEGDSWTGELVGSKKAKGAKN